MYLKKNMIYYPTQTEYTPGEVKSQTTIFSWTVSNESVSHLHQRKHIKWWREKDNHILNVKSYFISQLVGICFTKRDNVALYEHTCVTGTGLDFKCLLMVFEEDPIVCYNYSLVFACLWSKDIGIIFNLNT